MGTEKKKKQEHEYVTQTEFARRVGVNISQVNRAVKSGRIALSEVKNSQGYFLIDWEENKNRWEANRTDHLAGTGRAANKKPRKPDPQAVRDSFGDIPDVPDDVDGFTPENVKSFAPDERIKAEPYTYQWYATKKVKIDAERNQLKYIQEVQELIPFEGAVALFYNLLVSLRDGVMAIPSRNTGVLVARIKTLVKEWNEDSEDTIDTVVSKCLLDASKSVLSEIQTNFEKDFKEIARRNDKAKRKRK